MTDKDIIKALECCFSPYGCGDCPSPDKSCTDEDCAVLLSRESIALITCQKSQIEDLKEALEERMQRIKMLEAEIRSETAKMKIAADCIKQQGEEIERLKERLDAKCDICIERDKTAAIREFAWRLKLLLTPCPDCDFKEPVTSKQIDTLVKEMTEDTDNG